MFICSEVMTPNLNYISQHLTGVRQHVEVQYIRKDGSQTLLVSGLSSYLYCLIMSASHCFGVR